MKEKMTIIFFSGTMDKLIAALILATTGAAMGKEVSVFATFWGLNFFKNGKSEGKNFMQRLFSLVTPNRKKRLPLSQLNMLGVGPWMMEKLMKKTKQLSINELFDLAKQLGVKFYACTQSMQVMGIKRGELTDDVEDVCGAATFLGMAGKANINLFI